MKPKIKSWKRSPFVNPAMALAVAVVAAALLAHPMPAFASEREADAVRSNKLPQKTAKKAEDLSDAKNPKQTRQTKPVVRTNNLAATSKVKKGGTKKPRFDGIDGEFQDKDHQNWSVLDSFTSLRKSDKPSHRRPSPASTKNREPEVPAKSPSGGKVKVSDIPIIKPADKATAK